MSDIASLADRAHWRALAGVLGDWLGGQRWFQGKARTVTAVAVDDVALLPGEPPVADVFLRVSYRRGAPERYQLPLRAGQGLGTVAGVPLADALARPDSARTVGLRTLAGDAVRSVEGRALQGAPVGDGPPLPRAARPLGAEQSNTSVVFGDALLLKVFRKLESGMNPEVELTRGLTEAGFAHVPPQAGALVLEGPGGPCALAVMSTFMGGARDAWEVACAEVLVARQGGAPAPLEGQAGELGRVVGELHRTLERRFGGRPAGQADVAAWSQELHAQLDEVLATLEEMPHAGGGPVLDRAEALRARIAGLRDLEDAGTLIRTHGDLHLGQVLLHRTHGWQILDFEGEPARPLAERRLPHSPARDVAGLLRSFDYAAARGASEEEAAPPEAVAGWRDEGRATFLQAYLTVCGDDGLLPRSSAARQALLDAFELDKALYEVRYELSNRPGWVRIPLAGILRLLEQDDVPSPIDRQGVGSVTTQRGSQTAADRWKADPREVEALLSGDHRDPHRVLGPHDVDESGAVVRCYRPDATAVTVAVRGGAAVEAERTHAGGFFEARLDERPAPGAYTLRIRYGDDEYELIDPYAFWPSVGEIDLHLAGEGRHEELWKRLGAHAATNEGISGTAFAVWAPNALGVRVVGEFNSWDGRLHPMRMLGSSGIWELFVPDVGAGTRYKFELVTDDGRLVTRADPFAFWSEIPPGNASRVFTSAYEWGDDAWFARRAEHEALRSPVSVYEVHLGSWRRLSDGGFMNYRDIAHQLADHVEALGFTHVELLPVAEHPFGGSWGYQVSGYYAPTARFGDPDDFRYFVDHLHQRGIGIIVDWVPAHFPRDEFALARFDGTALFEHMDPRKGEHPDWGTLVFNYGRNEVRNFLVANALFWLEELHVDGLRVDAVASMLYLDYSRSADQWVPNEYGGRENLEAVHFVQELNRVVYGRNPHALMIAEESTAWPGVTKPVHLGGLGFGLKWNMGWMHDTLSYYSRDPIYRRFHHHELTFGLVYAWSESFILPLSHDEVVHGKRSMLDKMPGDRWQKFANLRALYGWMWAHPGKQLLFMGGEFGQWREWSEERELDWYVRGEHDHAGLERLVADLNRSYRDRPALWRRDHEPTGFQWIDANNADDNVLSFVRLSDGDHPPLVCVTNLSPIPREHLRIGLPRAGTWREVVNTDAEAYGGGNVGNLGAIEAVDLPWHGLPASAEIVAPPLATLWLSTDDEHE